MPDPVEAVAELGKRLESRFLERAEVVEGALVALGSRQHVLLLGPPGTAKSQLVQGLARSISGARYFQVLLTRFSKPEEVFGPISLKALEEDRYCRVTSGRLPEAEIAFVDEVFRASPAILNALLTIMNERVFSNDGVAVPCPLVTLFGASNDLPEGGEERELAAFADRFLLRYHVGYLSEDSDFLRMLSLPEDGFEPCLSMEDICSFQRTASSAAVPSEVLEALAVLRRSLLAEGITASDRRWRQAVSALKAKAALAGASSVSVDRDFDLLAHVLWSEPSQKKAVSKVIRKVADPLMERVVEALEDAEEVYRAAVASGSSEAGLEANRKLKGLISELEGISPKVAPGSRPRVEKAVEKIRGWNAEVLKTCLKI